MSFVKILLAFLGGWFICFGMVRSYFKAKYSLPESKGILRVAYDQDDPTHPAMGLEIESLSYILDNDIVILKISKIGFPDTKKPIRLESSKNKSA